MFRSYVLRVAGALIASATLVFSGPLTAQAAPVIVETGTIAGVTVTLDSEGALTIPDGSVISSDVPVTWSGITEGNVKKIVGNNITLKGDMSFLFHGAEHLTDINALSTWDTSNVTYMISMFEGASSLTNVDALINWDVSNVRDMGSMFGGASSLTNVDALINWDVSNVRDMSLMFEGASSLTNVDGLGKWDTSNATEMFRMFAGASSLTNVDGLAKWDTSNVIRMFRMFGGASSLTDISALAGWDTSNATNIITMFEGASSLAKASFANPNGFSQNSTLVLSASEAWEQITISKGAKPKLSLPNSITWMNQTRGDNKQVSSADMTAQIKAGNGEGVWVPFKTPVMVTNVSVSGASTVEVGKTVVLTATVSPSDVSNKGVSWESSDTTVATVDENGVVTAVKAGVVTITATAKDGSGVSGSLEVTVTQPAPPVETSDDNGGGSNLSAHPLVQTGVPITGGLIGALLAGLGVHLVGVRRRATR